MANAKTALRQRMRAVRDAIDPAVTQSAPLLAAEHVVGQVLTPAVTTVAVYASMRGEISTAPLRDRLLASGKALAFPRVVAGQKRMTFHRVRASTELATGCWGIPEPVASAPIVPIEHIDLFIVPGLAFDARGNRLGWGRGHYDVTLAENTQAIRVGFAFDCQVIDAVPSTSYDLPMDLVITEHRALQTGRGSRSEQT